MVTVFCANIAAMSETNIEQSHTKSEMLKYYWLKKVKKIQLNGMRL